MSVVVLLRTTQYISNKNWFSTIRIVLRIAIIINSDIMIVI